jgi:hypothetical protein
MRTCATCCVRGPSSSTGRIFVRGSMANQSHCTCLWLRSLVRSSSNCRCGSHRRQKKRSCMVCACSKAACEPPGNRGLSKVEDAFGRRRIQSFGQRREHLGDPAREGVFSRYNGVLRRARERGTAGLTPKRLDPLTLAMLAVADQSVDASVSVPEVLTLRVRAPLILIDIL